jgi:hypothetical protein
MLNDLVKDDDKKMVEPFNLVGRRAQIVVKKEAVKILRDNSYYIFLAAAIHLGISIFIGAMDIGISRVFLIWIGLFYCILGVCIRILKSRVASLLALASFGYALITRILEKDIGVFLIFYFIFLAASYRAAKASFFYYKVISTKI